MRPNYFVSKQIARRLLPFLGIAVVFAAFCLVVRAAETKYTLPPETATLKMGIGVDKATMCLTCHSVDYISIQPKFFRTVWKAEVVKMQQKYGAPIQTNDIDSIVDYLTAYYGKENPSTNAAPAK